MLQCPKTRAPGLALLVTVALCGGRASVTAQNKPAGAPAGAPATKSPPAPAASKPAAADSTTPAEETPAPATEPAPELPPSEEILPEPPPVPLSLFGKGQPEGPPPGLSENVTINLLRKLVEKKILTQVEAVEMIQQAEAEAEAEAEAARQQAKAALKIEAKEEEDVIRVNEVPQVVRNQVRDEVKQQVLAELRGGGGKDGSFPSIIAAAGEGFFGDIRLRYELIEYPGDNDNSGSFPNFNSINTGAPFDTAGNVFSPQYNVDKDRQRSRLRFRFGGEYDLDDNWHAGFRIATGENNSPTTTNQSLGLANQAQGGNFSKYAIWLDRAFMRWDREWENKSSFSFWAGRFDNPFFSTEIIFDEDVGFDGIGAKFKPYMGDQVKPFLTAGGFPVFNTDLNFSSNQPAKFSSTDKFLFAAQAGADFKLTKELTGRLAASYYLFDGVEGELSTPYTPINAQDAGDTDNTRPTFAQRGNTYRPLRQIIPDATNNFGTINQWQYYGLATPFRPVAVTGKLDWDHFEPIRISLFGEYIKNTAFDKSAINAIAVNNRGPVPAGGGTGAFEGSDTAWIGGVKVGHAALDKKGAWQAVLNYRWVGSDAVIDGFADSEFGGGGTNAKGWVLGGTWALSKSAAVGLSWLSSNQIAGPPLKVDYLQLDLKIKF